MPVIAAMVVLSLGGPLVAQDRMALPDQKEIARLVWSTLIAVDQANGTGNFTVLRDLGSPSFRQANTAADLARIFAGLAANDPGLSQVILAEPVFREPPRLTEDGKLYLAGSFPGRPVGVGFELLFEPIDGAWRLFGISVAPVGASTTPASP